MSETSPKASRRVPVGVDPTRASIARVYDAMLDGKDNYEIDREVKRALLATAPELETIARDNRQWLIRVTRFLAGTVKLGQIVDCGAGFPRAENTHEAASRVSSDMHVYYADNDPPVAVHGRALLEGSDRTFFLEADLTNPDEVFATAAEAGSDRGEPAGLMQVSTLHHVHDDLGHVELMRRYIDQLPGQLCRDHPLLRPGRRRPVVRAGPTTAGDHGQRPDGLGFLPHPLGDRGDVRRPGVRAARPDRPAGLVAGRPGRGRTARRPATPHRRPRP